MILCFAHTRVDFPSITSFTSCLAMDCQVIDWTLWRQNLEDDCDVILQDHLVDDAAAQGAPEGGRRLGFMDAPTGTILLVGVVKHGCHNPLHVRYRDADM
jgi:hypothetical protein